MSTLRDRFSALLTFRRRCSLNRSCRGIVYGSWREADEAAYHANATTERLVEMPWVYECDHGHFHVRIEVAA